MSNSCRINSWLLAMFKNPAKMEQLFNPRLALLQLTLRSDDTANRCRKTPEGGKKRAGVCEASGLEEQRGSELTRPGCWRSLLPTGMDENLSKKSWFPLAKTRKRVV